MVICDDVNKQLIFFLFQALPTITTSENSETTYKCPYPECYSETHSEVAFVRHYGSVHKVVQDWLKEIGILDHGIIGFDDEEKKLNNGEIN